MLSAILVVAVLLIKSVYVDLGELLCLPIDDGLFVEVLVRRFQAPGELLKLLI